MTIEELDNIIVVFDDVPPSTQNEKELLHLATHLRRILRMWERTQALDKMMDLGSVIGESRLPFYKEREQR